MIAPVRGIRVRMLPFVLVAPGQLLVTVVFARQVNPAAPVQVLALEAAVVIGLVLASQAACVFGWTRLVQPRRSGPVASVLGYLLACMIGSLVMTRLLSMLALAGGGVGLRESLLSNRLDLFDEAVVLAGAMVASTYVVAIIVNYVQASWRVVIGVREILQVKMIEGQSLNVLLRRAEIRVRQESAQCLEAEVIPPLRDIVRRGPRQSDAALADEVEAFIADSLRPLSHHLHPVSVRLGLVSAIRALSPAIDVDVDAAVQRLDSDGALLDENQRLQVYRWVRDASSTVTSLDVQISMEARTLRVRLQPAYAAGPLDAVQEVAGLRAKDPGEIEAPLRGQIPAPSTAAAVVGIAPMPVRSILPRLRDVITVPLAHQLGFVALLSSGALFTQLILVNWQVDLASMAASVAGVFAALLTTVAIMRFPQPRPTVTGGLTVVAGWILVAMSAAVAFAAVAYLVGVRPSWSDDLGLDVLRSIYRFTVPGLVLVLAHGMAVESRASLERAQATLASVHRKQAWILEEARLIDRDVAEALHRTVQARLSAAVVMLRMGRRDEAWALIVTLSTDTLPRLVGRVEPAETSGFLLVNECPPGLRAFESVNLRDPMPVALVSDLRRAVSEVCVNALLHGQADGMWVTVTSRSDGRVRLECRDNGRGAMADLSPGLGNRVLDEIVGRWGGDWNLTTHPDGGCLVTITVATRSGIPVATHHPGRGVLASGAGART